MALFLTILNIAWVIALLWVFEKIDFELVKMEPGNRMLRIGLGQNQGRWFFRIDVWFYGIRIT